LQRNWSHRESILAYQLTPRRLGIAAGFGWHGGDFGWGAAADAHAVEGAVDEGEER